MQILKTVVLTKSIFADKDNIQFNISDVLLGTHVSMNFVILLSFM